ncbi:MAG: peptidase M14 [Bacteroidia bacterium]|nr:MAG: peptidase M14 [Bacteroidia bacterium]
MNHSIIKLSVFSLLFSFLMMPLQGQVADGRAVGNFFKASGTPVDPKVSVSWNRYYTNEGLLEIYEQLVAAFPELITLESIGKSYDDRDLWLLTVTNKNNKPHDEKPGFWIDGNIHANEIQTAEVSVYTAWYLAEKYGNNSFITDLLDDNVFYILPVMNPDGRDHYMNQPNTFSTPRSGTMPLDDDGDGIAGEDGFDDLNGDGHITQMRRRNPYGQWRTDPNDPRRMVLAPPGEFGEWELLGWEGIDRDGDGRLNEDPEAGRYDHNRDWGWNWQPDYVQRGAYLYPFSLPETRAVRDFVMDHPNIAGAITHHNTGGMLLRGPGAREDERLYLREDVQVYDALGALGEKIIPGYDYLVLYQDLYTVYGGQIDWFHMMRGIFTFTSEMFSRYYLFNEEPTGGWGWGIHEDYFTFDKHLLFEDAFVPWEDYDHPQFGEIQIGGFKKNYIRVNPGFLLEQELHRLMAFTLFHAYHTPRLEIVELSARDLGGGLREVTAVIANTRLIPTHAGIDLRNRIERPNYVSLEGGNVLAGMIVQNRDLNVVEEQLREPAVIEVDNFPGMSTVTIRWIVEGGRRLSVTVDSAKGGVIRKDL